MIERAYRRDMKQLERIRNSISQKDTLAGLQTERATQKQSLLESQSEPVLAVPNYKSIHTKKPKKPSPIKPPGEKPAKLRNNSVGE